MRALLPLPAGPSTSATRPSLWLQGDVDISTLPELSAQLALWVDSLDPAPEAVIDVSGVTYLDPAGLRQLLVASERLADRGCRLRLRGTPRRVRRLLLITGHHDTFGADDQPLTPEPTTRWLRPIC